MPLLPPGEMFHSRVSSKFLNFSVVMMSAAGRTRVSAPSLTPHPEGIVSIFHPRQPTVEWPSNSRRQPAARSSGVNVLSPAGPADEPAGRLWAGAGAGDGAGAQPPARAPETQVPIRRTALR